MSIDEADLQHFEDAFRDHGGSCRIDCSCGKTYFTTDGFTTFDTGELEALEGDPKAEPVSFTPGYIMFEGNIYADCCTCWHDRAKMIAGFLNTHANEIAKYFALRKERMVKQAQDLPVIEI